MKLTQRVGGDSNENVYKNSDKSIGKEVNEQSSWRSVIHLRSYAIYICMLISLATVCTLAIKNGWDYGATTFATLLSFQLFFIILERIIPYEKKWHPSGKEWLRDATYFGLVCGAGAFSQGLVTSIATRFAATENHLSLMAEIPLALIPSTLASYLFHRLGHANIFFWQAHGIHHTPTKVNVANNSVTHSIDIIVPAIVTQVPLYILNFSAEAMFITLAFTAMQGYFVHANINMKMGPFSYFLATPEAHRLHHSLDQTEAGNYGSDIMIWDLLFGSFTWKENHAPKTLGIENAHKFPTTAAIHKNIIHPFVFIAKSVFSVITKQRKELPSPSDA